MGNNSHWPQRSWAGYQSPQCVSLFTPNNADIFGVINGPGLLTIEGETRVIRTVTPVNVLASSCLPFKLYCVYGYFTGADSIALELSTTNVDPNVIPYHRSTQPSRLFLGAIWVNEDGTGLLRLRSFYEPAQEAYSSFLTLGGSNIPVPYVGPPYNSNARSTPLTVRTILAERTEIVLPNEAVYLSAHFATSPQQNTVACAIGTAYNYLAGVTISTVNVSNIATISGISHSVVVGEYVWLTEIASTQAIKDKPQQITSTTPTSISFVDANITADETTVCCVIINYDSTTTELASGLAQGDSGVNLRHVPMELVGRSLASPGIATLENFYLAAQKLSNVGNAYINYLDQANGSSGLHITRDPNKTKMFL